jgi:hypothetical protein
MPELKRFESTKSMILYLPPNGTEGLGLPMVMGLRRSPLPPARTMAMVFRVMLPLVYMKLLLSVVLQSIEDFFMIRNAGLFPG